MALRRMFSTKIVESDDFLDMPHSSQLLYFHLSMYADDEGFVSPKKIMRMIGSNEDDLKILIGKRFLLAFKSGVVVIKHWLIHNTIRMDRFGQTAYQDERNSLYLSDNKSYTDNGLPNGNQRLPQYNISKVNISKYKLSKDNKNKDFLLQVKRLKEWNSNQSSPIQDFNPENIVKKHGVEKVNKLREKFGGDDNGFSKFLTNLNK